MSNESSLSQKRAKELARPVREKMFARQWRQAVENVYGLHTEEKSGRVYRDVVYKMVHRAGKKPTHKLTIRVYADDQSAEVVEDKFWE